MLERTCQALFWATVPFYIHQQGPLSPIPSACGLLVWGLGALGHWPPWWWGWQLIAILTGTSSDQRWELLPWAPGGAGLSCWRGSL